MSIPHNSDFHHGLLGQWLDLSDVIGLVAPRPLLVHWGEQDTDRAGRSAAYNRGSMPTYDAAREIYVASGAAENIAYHVSPGLRHEFDNEVAQEFLARWLRIPPSVADSSRDGEP